MSKIVAVGVVVAAVFMFNVNATMAESNEKGKVYICHMKSDSDPRGKVLMVSESAVEKHWSHGDPQYFVAYKNGSCEKRRVRRPRSR